MTLSKLAPVADSISLIIPFPNHFGFLCFHTNSSSFTLFLFLTTFHSLSLTPLSLLPYHSFTLFLFFTTLSPSFSVTHLSFTLFFFLITLSLSFSYSPPFHSFSLPYHSFTIFLLLLCHSLSLPYLPYLSFTLTVHLFHYLSLP